MPATLRHLTHPVIGLLLVVLGFSAGINQAAIASESAATDSEETMEDCQRHTGDMAPMMEHMREMTEMGDMRHMMVAARMGDVMQRMGQ